MSKVLSLWRVTLKCYLTIFRVSFFICKRRLSGLTYLSGTLCESNEECIWADTVNNANGDPLPVEYYFSNLVSFGLFFSTCATSKIWLWVPGTMNGFLESLNFVIGDSISH